jgi:hypothetical protein
MQDLTSPYLYKSNGLAECINPTIVLIVYSIIIKANKVCFKSLGAEVTAIVVYLKNPSLSFSF